MFKTTLNNNNNKKQQVNTSVSLKTLEHALYAKT